MFPPNNCKNEYSFNDLVLESWRLAECESTEGNLITRRIKSTPGRTIAFFMQHDDANAGYDSVSAKSAKPIRERKDPLPEILSRLLNQSKDNEFRLIGNASAHFRDQSNGYSTEGYLIIAKGYR